VTVPDDKQQGVSAWVTLFCGAVAGAVSRTCTAPLDRLKVIMQAQTSGSMTITEGFKGIYKEGGMKSFFRGNGTNVIKIAPETGIKFICFDKIKDAVCKDKNAPTTVERLISGASAGFTAQSLIYPLEICKTRLALAPVGTYSGIGGCVTKILAEEGPKALYKGWGASVCGIIPYAAIDLAMFNTIRDAYVNRYADQPSVMTLLCCGAFSGICGQLVSYPLALIRTLL
jgi:solute carrier family 25 (mitochondrial phosphate transporter), member 23/24/25/41